MSNTVWIPSQHDLTNSAMARFIDYANRKHNLNIGQADYAALHHWSITHPEQFWPLIWKFCNIQGELGSGPTWIKHPNFWQTQWFPEAKLNFAHNLLHPNNHNPAITSITESGKHRQISHHQLYQATLKLAHYLHKLGVKPGDRIAGFVTNQQESVIAMLASTLLGAIWSSCSPDFGLQGLLDRFVQIEPVVLFASLTHSYQGKLFNHKDKITALTQQLPNIKKIIIIDSNQEISEQGHSENYCNLTNIISPENQPAPNFADPIFQKLFPFNHPLYILYSSGTTGKPKCIIHSAGGTLLQHKKELLLHCDITIGDCAFFYTTCGWMMWNWLVSCLSLGVHIILYDGSPFYPNSSAFFDWIDQYGIHYLGAGASYFENLEKQQAHPIDSHQLTNVKTIFTTGSPLATHSFDYIQTAIKPTIHIASISGGTDIVSCFALGNPLLPVYRGELQCLGLGMDVKIFDYQGQAVSQQKGELVCTTPFPSMPLGFWNDDNHERYQRAYFNKFSDVWSHGDYAEITEHGGMIIYGRSDATLNIGGVRIGTAEIYRVVAGIPRITDSLAISYQSDANAPKQANEILILFVVLQANLQLDSKFIDRIKQALRTQASPRHVPQLIIAAPDLPRTLSGKLVELAVKHVLHRQPVQNLSALANPESLKFFEHLDLEKLL